MPISAQRDQAVKPIRAQQPSQVFQCVLPVHEHARKVETRKKTDKIQEID
jgi:hypothetical protein